MLDTWWDTMPHLIIKKIVTSMDPGVRHPWVPTSNVPLAGFKVLQPYNLWDAQLARI